MTPNLRFPLATLLLVGATLLSAAPPASAHICMTQVLGPDPADCDAHDCETDDELHLGHVVLHLGDGGGFHGCGVLFHAGVDGMLREAYLCLGVATGCILVETAGAPLP